MIQARVWVPHEHKPHRRRLSRRAAVFYLKVAWSCAVLRLGLLKSFQRGIQGKHDRGMSIFKFPRG